MLGRHQEAPVELAAVDAKQVDLIGTVGGAPVARRERRRCADRGPRSRRPSASRPHLHCTRNSAPADLEYQVGSANARSAAGTRRCRACGRGSDFQFGGHALLIGVEARTYVRTGAGRNAQPGGMNSGTSKSSARRAPTVRRSRARRTLPDRRGARAPGGTPRVGLIELGDHPRVDRLHVAEQPVGVRAQGVAHLAQVLRPAPAPSACTSPASSARRGAASGRAPRPRSARARPPRAPRRASRRRSPAPARRSSTPRWPPWCARPRPPPGRPTAPRRPWPGHRPRPPPPPPRRPAPDGRRPARPRRSARSAAARPRRGSGRRRPPPRRGSRRRGRRQRRRGSAARRGDRPRRDRRTSGTGDRKIATADRAPRPQVTSSPTMSERRYDPQSIEPKWQDVWARERTWEVSNEDIDPAPEVLRAGDAPLSERRAPHRAPEELRARRRDRALPPAHRPPCPAPDGLRRLRAAGREPRDPHRGPPAALHRRVDRRSSSRRSGGGGSRSTGRARSPRTSRRTTAGRSGSSCSCSSGTWPTASRRRSSGVPTTPPCWPTSR